MATSKNVLCQLKGKPYQLERKEAAERERARKRVRKKEDLIGEGRGGGWKKGRYYSLFSLTLLNIFSCGIGGVYFT